MVFNPVIPAKAGTQPLKKCAVFGSCSVPTFTGMTVK
jgi:hypothetical protein